jgi:2,3-dihydroxybenzoate decarboxylase
LSAWRRCRCKTQTSRQASFIAGIRDLNFKGALVNGYSQAEGTVFYYDLPQYIPFWGEIERAGVPLYLHPRDGTPGRDQPYEGHPWLIGSPWSFGEETALHALRLMGSGLFDKYPKLQIVLGHLGERIPYDLWRLDHRLSKIPDRPAKHPMSHYFRSNFHITTSGHFCTSSMMQAISVVGVDRILFAVDYPFEDNESAAAWFDQLGLAEPDQAKIARLNALALFKLN